jgi:hypothetical protein
MGMKMIKNALRGFGRAFLILACFACSPVRAEVLLAPLTSLYEPHGSVRLKQDFGFFLTKSNYRSDGTSVIPGSFNQLKRIHSATEAMFGWTPQFSGGARLTVANIEYDRISQAQGKSNTGIDSIAGLLNSRLIANEDGSALDLGLELSFPLHDGTASTTNDPPVGDGAADVNVFGTYGFVVGADERSRYRLAPLFGLTYRTNDYPLAVRWSALASREVVNDGIIATIGLFATHSFSNKNVPASRVVSASTEAGGSFMIKSPQPSHLSFLLKPGYQFSKATQVFASYQQTLSGSFAPAGWQGVLSGVFRFGSEPSKEEELTTGSGTERFSTYGLSASVTRTNDQLYLIKINRGSEDGVEEGQLFDLFEPGSSSREAKPLARARVTAVKGREAALKVIEYHRQQVIEDGTIARRVL